MRTAATVPTERQLARIYRAAMDAYPAEACGFVTAAEVWECVNAVEQSAADGTRVSDRRVETGYALRPADILRIERSLDSDDPVVLIYHSHPDVGAYFSAEDQRHAVVDGIPAYPVDHLVLDVTSTGVRGARRFGFSAVDRRYVATATYGRPTPEEAGGENDA